ncbi:MAG: hypothetical protein LLG37_00200 [Spirochaetia bacterium]|nr:hypothetical protein [Spirochaetia bacterium]
MTAALYLISQAGFKSNITVMMPYAGDLSGIPRWFATLWAGSLAKKFSIFGRILNTDLKPVESAGFRNRYSQNRLYMEGPYVKAITFIRTEDFRQETQITSGFNDDEPVLYFPGKPISGWVKRTAGGLRDSTGGKQERRHDYHTSVDIGIYFGKVGLSVRNRDGFFG